MSRRVAETARRAPVLAVIVTALVAGGLVDRSGGTRTPVAPSTVQPVPVAPPADALSSSWFCAGATDVSYFTFPGAVVIANDGSTPATAAVTVVSTSGTVARIPTTVPAYGSTVVPETVPGGSPWVGAIVDVNAGAVAVEQVIGGPLGVSESPCATSGSNRWYFPSGQTRINADEAIELINPYPTDSIVDLTFSTDQGIEQPVDFQGIDVPPGGLVSIDVGSRLRRRASIAATVKARTGSIVAWQTAWVVTPPKNQPLVGTPAAQNPLADPALPQPGVTLTLGAPSAGTSWTWPDGLAGTGMDEQYVVYNPGAAPAEVRLSVGLQQGQAEPFEFSVGPGEVVPVVSEQQARIPAGVPHSATLTSVNGVPVVAERTVTATGAGNGADVGAGRLGIAGLLGGRLPAADWLIPFPGTDAAHGGQMILLNPGPRPVTARLARLAGSGEALLPGAAAITVPAEGRAAVPVPAGQNTPLVLRSDGPVYTEYDLAGLNGTPGLSFSFGVPLS